ncbi:hypothetical protein SmJEL517_g02532 [Synchytrium microbalum]|uniref:Dynein light chain n=1 Tax=Synchytrium microbalum TaxID=1806994 RepID=A0A507CBA4_9FUNG|nr:uncharacterized protein SmJEL517_g02532 [Synchytrium microbalum]TPX34813.1 hypothetical protein SmJEL517_g02532 [Synchytrium microbalum]
MADLGSLGNLAEKAPAAAAAGGQSAAATDKADAAESRKAFNYPLVKVCDMVDEVRVEAVDSVVTAVEKHANNFEAAAKSVKELMDKRCGTSWHVVVGEGFGFEVTHEIKNLLFMFFGNVGVLLWKQSS